MPNKPDEVDLRGKYELFRKKIMGVTIPTKWGVPQSDLGRIEEAIKKRMKFFAAPSEADDLGLWYFNPHDLEHIKRVIGFIYELLHVKRLELEDHEQYILYIAAYGHDLGMTDWGLELKKAYEEILGKIDTTAVRNFHALAGANILEEILAPYIKKPDVRAVISEIASYHSGNSVSIDIIKLDGRTIRRPLLIALLRIADTMDAAKDRLPSEEIIAKCIALASTCPEPFKRSLEHYVRRYLILSCHCDKAGIKLRVRRGFQSFKVETPVFKKGESISMSGKEAFIGVLQEFSKELGSPENLDELKQEFPDLNWDQVDKASQEQTSNSLLLEDAQKISWRVELIGHPEGVLLPNWIKKAREYRQEFDTHPHPIERLLSQRCIIKLEPEIKSLMPIQEALAAQADLEPNPFRWRPLFWQDIERLFKRGECEEILELFKQTNAIFLEGYPASGKSSIVCRLAYDLVNKGESVYYGNLTTRMGILNCTPKDLPQKLLAESKKVTQRIFIIIEDIHHMISEYDRLNPLAAHGHIKLLLTSRPLEQFDIESYLGRKQGGRRLYFQWIAPQNRKVLKTDKWVVKKILNHGNLPFNNLEPVMKIVGEEKPNLLLLSFMIQASLEKRKPIDKITRDDIMNLVKQHLEELGDRACNYILDQTLYWRLMGTISVLSEFEVPVEKGFLSKLHAINDSLLQILQQLEREREVFCFRKLPGYEKYYLIPHSRLASLYRSSCVEDEERLDVLRKYILQGEFFGTLTRRLGFEESELLEKFVKRLEIQLVQRELSKANLQEIGHFLWEIGSVNRKLASEIVQTHRDILTNKDLSKARLYEIRDWLRAICFAKKEVLSEIVQTHRDTLRNKNLSKARLYEIGDFLWWIRLANKEVAMEVAENQRDTLRNKDLSKARLYEIGKFLMGVSIASESVAKEIVQTHRDTLDQKLYNATSEEIRYFLWGVRRANRQIATEIVRSHEDVLHQKGCILS